MTGLAELGWTPELDAAFAGHLAAGRRPARVMVEHQHAYTVRTADGEGTAAVSGRYRFETRGPDDFPAVGDWVAIDGAPDTATIHALLPRRSAFTRLVAGRRVGRPGRRRQRGRGASSPWASTATSTCAGSSATSPWAGRAGRCRSSS